MSDKQSRRVQVVVPSKSQIRYVFPDTKPNIFNIRNTSSESTVYFKMSGIASNTKYDNVLYPNGTIVSGDVVPMTEVSFYNDGLVEANIILASQYDENATLADFGAKNVQIINQKENPISINADGFIRGISLPYIYEGEESYWRHSIPVTIDGTHEASNIHISNSNGSGVIVRGVKYGTPFQGSFTDEEFSPFIPVDLRKSQLPDSNPIPVKVVGGSSGGSGTSYDGILKGSTIPDTTPVPVKIIGGSTGGGGSSLKPVKYFENLYYPMFYDNESYVILNSGKDRIIHLYNEGLNDVEFVVGYMPKGGDTTNETPHIPLKQGSEFKLSGINISSIHILGSNDSKIKVMYDYVVYE